MDCTRKGITLILTPWFLIRGTLSAGRGKFWKNLSKRKGLAMVPDQGAREATEGGPLEGPLKEYKKKVFGSLEEGEPGEAEIIEGGILIVLDYPNISISSRELGGERASFSFHQILEKAIGGRKFNIYHKLAVVTRREREDRPKLYKRILSHRLTPLEWDRKSDLGELVLSGIDKIMESGNFVVLTIISGNGSLVKVIDRAKELGIQTEAMSFSHSLSRELGSRADRRILLGVDDDIMIREETPAEKELSENEDHDSENQQAAREDQEGEVDLVPGVGEGEEVESKL